MTRASLPIIPCGLLLRRHPGQRDCQGPQLALRGLGGYHRPPRTFLQVCPPLPHHTTASPATPSSGVFWADAGTRPSLFVFGFGIPCLSLSVHVFTY